jgi:peptide/nickel transport system substrate-binding protein
MSGDAPTNFGHIDNTAYTEGVAKAAEMPGAAGCSTWLDAESNLVKDADVIPFANTVLNTFGNKAEFAMSGSITPTSIRMLG